MPGGWADPTDTPRSAVEREIREESGYEARALKLAAVYERARQGHVPPHPFAVFKLFFLCERVGGRAQTSAETSASTSASASSSAAVTTMRLWVSEKSDTAGGRETPERATRAHSPKNPATNQPCVW